MDWMAKFLNLPDHFLSTSPGSGGGVINASGSEGILLALITARELTVEKYLNKHPGMSAGDIRGKLVAYSSDQANCAISKAGILAAVPIRLLETDAENSLRGTTLRNAIAADVTAGLIPCAVLVTLGTTSTCAMDNLPEVGEICHGQGIFLHVDAAYAGAAFCCEEYQWMMRGLEYADSININAHKALLVSTDCSCVWFKDSDSLVKVMSVERTYLSHKFQNTSAKAPDLRHWGVALSRRMRSLKVWFTWRSLGAQAIRERIRRDAQLAKLFERFVRTDDRFEVVSKAVLGLVVFRLRAGCKITKRLLDLVTRRRKIYMVPTTVKKQFVIRFVVGGTDPQEKDIRFAWTEIQEALEELERVEGRKEKQFEVILQTNNPVINPHEI